MTIALYFFLVFAFCTLFTLEVIAPAAQASCDRRWMRIAGAVNMAGIACALVAGVLFQAWFTEHALVTLPQQWPSVLVGAVCFLTSSFVAYWWHRAMHRFDFLWRVFHQLHHSPRRIEALTAFYVHPLDSIAATFINSLCAYLVFGASATEAAWAILFAGLYNLLIHTDKPTPYWLGFWVSRPEMHRVHHKTDFHANNYGLPVWDLLFGTWENPRQPIAECGFSEGRDLEIYRMLKLQDVHASTATAENAAQR